MKAPYRFGLSLVSIEKLQVSGLNVLGQSPYSRALALTPSHFFQSETPMVKRRLVERADQLKDFGLSVHSLQGLFYGVDFADKNEVEERLRWICQVSEVVDARLLVVGTPQLRELHPLWEQTVSRLADYAPPSVRVTVENICREGHCRVDSSHGWGGISDPRVGRTFDFANALECTSGMLSSPTLDQAYDLIHLSGPNHGDTLTSSDERRLRAFFLRKTPAQAPVVLEIFSTSVQNLVTQANQFVTRYFE